MNHHASDSYDSVRSVPTAGAVGSDVPRPSGQEFSALSHSASKPFPPQSFGSAAKGMRDYRHLALVCIQLVLVVLVIYQYQLESRTFFNVMLMSAAGFVIHVLLPLEYRLRFFVGLSFATIVVALGLFDGLALIAMGLLMIGICHLPITLGLRVLALALTGALFALWRLELLPGPWSVAIWPILGSMFMFRIAVYLHALKHDEKHPSPARTLAYFFMLPNVCFPLFPVVDYSTFRRTYYDRDAELIYATGMKWIIRGLVHLILYRFVYLHLTVDPTELETLGELVQFLVSTFLLYLRVSGQFHLITGVLHLYGFRLPETHHLYYLASSFTDFWRRINIYWKDFMMKLVYYPSFFKLKRFGPGAALAGSTIIVFLATWLLHSYQWFWLRGGFPLEPQDGLFWGTLGALVVIGALREMRRSRARTLGRPAGWNAALAFRTLGTFTAICVLWSLWSADSVTAWLLMWSAAARTSARELLTMGALILIGLAIAGRTWPTADVKAGAGGPTYRAYAVPAATLLTIVMLGLPHLYSAYLPSVATTVASIQRSTLNARDAALQHKGYYENLDNASRMSAQLWGVTAQKPAHWVGLSATEAFRTRNDFLDGELRPNVSMIFMDRPFTTNAWGMRDQERVLAKPAGVYRIAVLGPSHVMGSGVSDEETFARYLEERLNRLAGDGFRYEVLNFGIAGDVLSQQLAIFRNRALRFDPDAVFFTDSQGLVNPIIGHLLKQVALKRDIPFPRLQNLLQETQASAVGHDGIPVLFGPARALFESMGVKTRMPWLEAEQRLRRSADQVLRTTLEEMSDLARKNGVVPVFVGLDTVIERRKAVRVNSLNHAASVGMLVFDLFDVWRGQDMDALRIARWDNHPNAAGNRLIADRLVDLMQQHRVELKLNKSKLKTAVNPSHPSQHR